MKKVILFIAMVSAVSLAGAQDNKMWLGGTISYSTESYDPSDSKYSRLVFGPNFGYMVTDKIAVGLGLGIANTTGKDLPDGPGTYEWTESSFDVIPFVRYYKSLGDNFSLYGEFAIGIGSGKYSEDHSDATLNPSDEEFSTFSLGIAPGIQYWFGNKWSINAQWGALQYSTRTDKDQAPDGSDEKTNNFTIGLDLSSMNFGLNYHF